MKGSWLAAFTALWSGALCHAGAPSGQPNFLVINIDDLDFCEIDVDAYKDYRKFATHTGAKALGVTSDLDPWTFYNDPRFLTPNIRQLAEDGAVCTSFYVTSPVCTPSRYGLLCGRYASKSAPFLDKYPPGSYSNLRWDTFIDSRDTTVIRSLKNMGYVTGIAGKWHNGGPGVVSGVKPADDPRDPAVVEKLRHFYDLGQSNLMHNIGFDYAESLYLENLEQLGLPKPLAVHNQEWITDAAVKFLDTYHDRPFFLYMALTLPHSHSHEYLLSGDPKATPAGYLDKVPQVQPSRASAVKRLKDAGIDPRNVVPTWIDDGVGAVLAKLNELGLRDNTVVVLASDHGFRGKMTCYQGAHAPCILRWPGKIKSGSLLEPMIANIDIAPTLITAAGGTPPADMDGKNLIPLLNGETNTAHDTLLLECTYSRALISGKWKLIINRVPPKIEARMQMERELAAKDGRRPQTGWDGQTNENDYEKGVRYGVDRDFPAFFDKDQLYDLEADPYEQKNLADNPEYADILRKMKERFAREISGMPYACGEFKPK